MIGINQTRIDQIGIDWIGIDQKAIDRIGIDSYCLSDSLFLSLFIFYLMIMYI